jgi:hypothetical protein
MSRGYAEGPATEEREAVIEELKRSRKRPPRVEQRLAVYGATEAQPDRHFIGWRDEVDPTQLFDDGKAWGLSVVKRRAESVPPGA